VWQASKFLLPLAKQTYKVTVTTDSVAEVLVPLGITYSNGCHNCSARALHQDALQALRVEHI
jgi:hypothetical protein